MKHKMNAGPGLIVALGAPTGDASSLRSDAASLGKMGRSGSSALPPNDGDPEALSQAANTDTVPVSMLAMPDDQEQMQPPEVGDVVNYQVTGKVTAIEGDYATVQRQSINGQELQDDDETNGDNVNPQNANQSAEDDPSSLRSDAANIGMLG